MSNYLATAATMVATKRDSEHFLTQHTHWHTSVRNPHRCTSSHLELLHVHLNLNTHHSCTWSEMQLKLYVYFSSYDVGLTVVQICDSTKFFTYHKTIEYNTHSYIIHRPTLCPNLKRKSKVHMFNHVHPYFQGTSERDAHFGVIQGDHSLGNEKLPNIPNLLAAHLPCCQYSYHEHVILIVTTRIICAWYGKGKVLPYSLPSVGPGTDPGVQAVSPQVTWSHPPHRRLILFAARPVVTFPAEERHRPLAGTKL